MCYRDCECTRGIRRLESAGVWQPVRRLIPRIVVTICRLAGIILACKTHGQFTCSVAHVSVARSR
jgi:hypothetical protein